MRNLLLIIAAALVALSACKTTEENYRKAYETAKEAGKDKPLSENIYTKMRNEARPGQVILGSDTLPLRGEFVKITKEQPGAPSVLANYCVVVAQFKQLFNANSMRQRLVDAGYVDAMIVETREPLYYVVIRGCSNAADAVKLLKQLRENPPIRLRDPFPWVLTPSRF